MTHHFDTLQWAYVLVLFAAGMWAVRQANEPMVRTFLVMVANFLVLETVRGTTGDTTPLKAMIVVDFITAVVILLPRITTPQMFIGEVFFFQIGLTTGMLLTGKPESAIDGFVIAINAAGWLQIALMLIGTHYGTGKRRWVAGSNRGYGRGAAGHAGAGVAQP